MGLAFRPGSRDLYTVVNERDGLGDDLPPDYFTKLQQGGFYGWPYAYTGQHPQPGYAQKKPEMAAKSVMPDVLFQSHSAPLGLVFYDGKQFPALNIVAMPLSPSTARGNRAKPTGYKVVRVHFKNGKPVGGYDNFLTGWWSAGTDPAQVWGRPVGIAVAKDGSLLVADDAGGVIWRVSYLK